MPAVANDVTDLDLAAHSAVNVLTAVQCADRAAWARMIHDGSPRRHGPFVAVCGHAVPPVNAEDVDEWFQRVVGGTLFVDHVGALRADAQARLLRLLSEQSRRATLPPAYHFPRVIAGSHRSLRRDVADAVFSDALFYRLNVIHIAQLP